MTFGSSLNSPPQKVINYIHTTKKNNLPSFVFASSAMSLCEKPTLFSLCNKEKIQLARSKESAVVPSDNDQIQS